MLAASNHPDRADRDPEELAREEVGLVVELVVCDDNAGAVDHLRAERQQQRHRPDQQVVGVAALRSRPSSCDARL